MEQYDNRRIRGLSALIGNTPLLAIDFMFQGRKRTIYAKAENLNLTGSIKDRMALYIMAQGYAKGLPFCPRRVQKKS
jgi:cysteine synthase A